MVLCLCGKPLEKVPSWLDGVKISFICQNCPNRTVKSIASVTLPPTNLVPKTDFDKIPGEVEEEEEKD